MKENSYLYKKIRKIDDDELRPTFHFTAPVGWINDPNGFSYFDGKWVVFYQNFPFGAAHGLKCWVQLESDDLVHFTETGLRVLPDTPLDSHGAYSGSAMQFDDKLFLFNYVVGGTRDLERFRQESADALGGLRELQEDEGDAV